MAGEFVVKNGLISKGNATIFGTLSATTMQVGGNNVISGNGVINQIPYFNSASGVTSTSAFTFDGNTLALSQGDSNKLRLSIDGSNYVVFEHGSVLGGSFKLSRYASGVLKNQISMDNGFTLDWRGSSNFTIKQGDQTSAGLGIAMGFRNRVGINYAPSGFDTMLTIVGNNVATNANLLDVQKADATTALKVMSSGNVTIGSTADTGNALYVNGSTYTTGSITAPNLILTSPYTVSGYFSQIQLNNSTSFKTESSFVWSSPYGSPVTKMQLFDTGNLLIQSGGTFTDAGYRLDVNGSTRFVGDSLIKGIGNTSATFALMVQNSDGTNILRVRNDNTIYINANTNFGSVQFYPVNNGLYTLASNATELRIESTFINGTTTGDFGYSLGTFSAHNTSHSSPKGLLVLSTFSPTSGTQTFTNTLLISTINQTGGANGITRGLYVNPTLTSAYDWRSVEWSNNSGWGLYGAGTAPNYLNGDLLIGTNVDSIYKLDVNGSTRFVGDSLIKGTGNTSATTALRVQNSDGVTFFRARNDGSIGFGSDFPEIFPTVSGSLDINGGSLTLRSSQASYSSTNYHFYFKHVYTNSITTSGTSGGINLGIGFNPTTGSGIFNSFIIANAINQTGGASGITRGLYVEPTLTSAYDWRSIEWNNNTGWGLYGAGTAPNYLNGNTLIGTTTNAGYKLDVNGTARIQSNLTVLGTATTFTNFIKADGIYGTSTFLNNPIYVFKNTSIGVSAAALSSTGAMRIKLPVGSSSIMFKMYVSLYSYDGPKIDYVFYGYEISVWANVGATSNVYATYPIRFGHASDGKALIFIGDTTTNWGTYSPSIVISEIQVTGWIGNVNNATALKNTSAYDFSMVTGFTADTINATINSTSPSIKYNNASGALSGSVIFAGASGGLTEDNANLFWDSVNGRLGIGTNTPTATTTINRPVSAGAGTILSLNYGNTPVVTVAQNGWTTTNYLDVPNYIMTPILKGRSGTDLTFGSDSTNYARLFSSTGNLTLQTGGTFTDAGYKLDVNGTLRATSTASVGGLKVGFATGSNAPYIFTFNTNAGVPDSAYRNLSFYSYAGSSNTSGGAFTFAGDPLSQTSGSSIFINTANSFIPTSGNSSLDIFKIVWTINQTGGASGITRGLYVEPTLTSAYDWRSIEWNNNTGWGLYGAGTAPNYLNGNTLIGTTTNAGYKLDVNGATRVGSSLRVGASYSGGTNEGISYNFIHNAGLGSVSFVRYDSYVAPNFVNISQPNFGSTANGSQLNVSVNGNTPSGFALIKASAGAGGSGGGTFIFAGNSQSVTSGLQSLAKLEFDFTYLGPAYNLTRYAALDIKISGRTADYAAPSSTNIVGIYLQNNLLNQYSSTYLPAQSWKAIDEVSTFSYMVTPYTGIHLRPTFSNVFNSANHYGIDVTPTLNGMTSWTSIRWSNNTGWGLYGSGTSANYLAGNLLLGTTADTGNKLTINGSGAGGALMISNGNVYFGSTSGFTWDDTNGRLGIGTTSPNTALTIKKSGLALEVLDSSNNQKFAVTDNGVSSNSYIFLRRTVNTNDIFQVFFPAGTLSSSNVNWNFGMNGNSNDFVIASYDGTSVTNRMKFSNTGLIAAGTQTPTAVLDVAGSTTSATSLRIRQGTAPTSPNNGDIWQDNFGLYAYINSTTYNLLSGATAVTGSTLTGSGSSGRLSYWSNSNTLTSDANLNWDSANGRLGIGTASPTRRLFVTDTDTANPVFEAVNNASTTYIPVFEVNAPNATAGQQPYFAIGRNRANNNQVSLGFYYAGNGSSSNRFDINFYGLTNVFSILANKNTLVGTSTDSGYRLEVSGSGATNGALRTTSGNVYFGNTSGFTWDDTNKRLGIGTSSPATTLHIVGVGNTSATNVLTVQNSDTTNLFTVRNDGVSTFRGSVNVNLGNLSTTYSQNTATGVYVSNTNTGGSAYAEFMASSNAGEIYIRKNSQAKASYKIISSSDAALLNTNLGDISILNDSATGNIKLAAGGLATAQMTIASTGNVYFGSTSGFTWDDANARVGIGTTSPVSKLQTSGNITAVSGTAMGVYFNNTLTASANNDILIGLDISPTFVTSGFTTQNIALRLPSSANIVLGNDITFGTYFNSTTARFNGGNTTVSTSGNFLQLYAQSSSGLLWLNAGSSSNGTLRIDVAQVQRLNIFNTGNVTIQSGGTFTDAGYRLDINGSGATNGALRVTTGNVYFGSTSAFTWDDTNKRLSVSSADATGYIGTRGTSPAGFVINSDGFAKNIILQTSSTDRLIVFSSGNVGINTATDNGYRLNVNGPIATSSGFTAGVGQSAFADVLYGATAYYTGPILKLAYNGVLAYNFDFNTSNTSAIGGFTTYQGNQTYSGSKIRITGQENGFFSQTLGTLSFERAKANYEQGGFISVTNASTPTSGSQHSYMSIGTTPSGSNTSVEVIRINGNQNVIIQSGGTFTDDGYRLEVNGSGATNGAFYTNAGNVVFGSTSGFTWNDTTRRLGLGTTNPSAPLTISNTYTGGTYNELQNIGYTHSGGYGYGSIIFSQYYGATRLNLSNNGTGVSLDMANDAFTIQTTNIGSITMNTRYHSYNTALANGSYTWNFQSTPSMLFASTGNLIIQSGSPTDAGYRLDINASGATNGALRTRNGNVYFGSTSAFTWDDTNGRLGIGTSSPINDLSIVKSTTAAISIRSTSSTEFVAINFYNSANNIVGGFGYGNSGVNSTYSNKFYFAGVSGVPISFIVNNSEYLRMFPTTGNLMLQNGGTFTDGGQRLQVIGSMRVGSTAASAMYWDDTNSRLGIGTSSPTFPLQIDYSNSAYGVGLLINNTSSSSSALAGFTLKVNNVNGGSVAYQPSNYVLAAQASCLIIASAGNNRIGLVANSNQNGTAQDIFFSTYGSNSTYQLIIKADGKIGVNNNTPTSWLDLPGSTTSLPSLRIRSGLAPTTPNEGDIWQDGTSLFAYINSTTYNLTSGTTVVTGGTITGNGASGRLAFWSNTSVLSSNSNLFWDNANGRLGIGTSSPSVSLDVVGNTVVTYDRNDYARILLNNPNSGNSAFSTVEITSDTASGGFQFGKYSSTKVPYAGVNAKDGFIFNYGYGDLVLANTAAGGIKFIASGASTAQMTVASTGNVLIGGTTDSGYKLNVNGTSRFQADVEINAGTNGALMVNNAAPRVIFAKTSTPRWAIQIDTENAGQFDIGTGAGYPYNTFVSRLSIDTSGNVGIGATPSYKLDVNGSVRALSGLTTNGSIGIGTTSPTDSLDVRGTGRFTNQTGSSFGGSLYSGSRPTNWPFPSDTGSGGRQTIIGQSSTSTVPFPVLNAYGSMGIAGVGGSATGGRVNIGVLGYQTFTQTMGGNAGNAGYGGYFLAKGTGYVTDFIGSYVGVYGEANIGLDSTSGGGLYGGAFYALGGSGQTIVGVSSTVTNNNGGTAYAYYGGASATQNTWNLYMAGAAPNYLNANTLIGTTTNAGYKLDVNGTARVTERFYLEEDSSATTQSTAVIQNLTTNSGVAIVPNGTGAFTLSIPVSGTTGGGNPRGTNAIDLGITRSAADKVASGNNSIVIGNSNKAASPFGIAIGNNASTGAIANGIAIGDNVNASQQYTIAIGRTIVSLNDNMAMAIGNTISNVGGSTVAIGNSISNAVGYNSVAIGTGPSVTSNYSVAIGGQSNAAITATHATVIGGLSNTASGQYSFAGGMGSTSSGYGSFAFGADFSNIKNSATTTFSIAIGGGNTSSGYGSVAMGHLNSATTSSTVALGSRSYAYMFGQQALAMGQFSVNGDAQQSNLTARMTSDLASSGSTKLSTDGTGVTGLITPAGTNRIWNVEVKSIAVVTSISGTATGVAVGDTFMQNDKILFKRISSSSSVVGNSAVDLIYDTSMATASIVYSAGAAGDLEIRFIAPVFAGGGTVNFRVVSKIELVEVAY